jgi:ketopantoate reductase
MEVVVVGAGAIGSLLGSLARLDGHAVTLVGRGGTAVRRAVRLALPAGWKTVEGFSTRAPARADLALVALGRHHLAALRRGQLPLPRECPPAVFLNVDPEAPGRLGLDAAAWSPGVTLLAAVRLQEDTVTLAGPRPTLVVEKRSGAGRLARGFARHGVAVVEVEDARPHLDAAFVTRLLELPATMCGGTVRWFLSFPEGRELGAGVLAEGLKTLERSGRPLARLPVDDPRELLEAIRRRPREFDRARDLPDRALSPLLQAVLSRRPPEAREITMRAVEMASATGLSLTWNWRLFQKAGRVASVGFYHDPAELARAIA